MGGHKTQVWELNIHLYNSVNFGECIGYRRYAVHLCRKFTEGNENLIKFQPYQSDTNMYDFNKCLKSKAKTGKTILKGLVCTKKIGCKQITIITSQN